PNEIDLVRYNSGITSCPQRQNKPIKWFEIPERYLLVFLRGKRQTLKVLYPTILIKKRWYNAVE
ncbi:MAG: hypothetical protein ACE14V_12635, partial [bacterium]